MRTQTRTLFAVLVAAGTLSACTEPSSLAPTESGAGSFGDVTACELAGSITDDVYPYFTGAALFTAKQKAAELNSACAAGAQALVTQHAGELLSLVEHVLEDGSGGDPARGSSLTNSLLSCTGSLCTSAARPGIDFSRSLGPRGMFAFRTGSNALPAVARGWSPFTAPDGTANAALWGAESSLPWAQANATPVVLIFGAPVSDDPLDLRDVGVGGLQYDVKRWPAIGRFVGDDIVHVSVCFQSLLTLPLDDNGAPLRPRMQRERTLLTLWEPGFCPQATSPASASVFAPLLGAARALLPARSGFFFVSQERVPRIGGSALDFSRFAPVAAATSGALELLSHPAPVIQPGQIIGPLHVQAVSGGGTGMERVRVSLSILNNRGVPAGAILRGTTVAFTNESDGIATFDNVSIEKPGGYIICATAELPDYTFQRICGTQFHIRK